MSVFKIPRTVVPRDWRSTRLAFHELSFHEMSFHKLAFHKVSFHELSFHELSFHELPWYQFTTFHALAIGAQCAHMLYVVYFDVIKAVTMYFVSDNDTGKQGDQMSL
jgi:hypothetical protein